MTKPLKIDFVSDVSCPWCVIGLRGLEQALERVGDLVEADIHFQPFELNPQMPTEGENMVEHISRKYGSAPADYAARREQVRALLEAARSGVVHLDGGGVDGGDPPVAEDGRVGFFGRSSQLLVEVPGCLVASPELEAPMATTS